MKIDSFEPNNKQYFETLLNFTEKFNQSREKVNNLDSMWDASSKMIGKRTRWGGSPASKDLMFENYDRSP